MKVVTGYATYENCHLVLNTYKLDDSLCIDIVNDEDGQIARITKCFPDGTNMNGKAFVDINNCPWAEDFIKEYMIGKPLGISMISGWCEYPMYQFIKDEIMKYVRGNK